MAPVWRPRTPVTNAVFCSSPNGKGVGCFLLSAVGGPHSGPNLRQIRIVVLLKSYGVDTRPVSDSAHFYEAPFMKLWFPWVCCKCGTGEPPLAKAQIQPKGQHGVQGLPVSLRYLRLPFMPTGTHEGSEHANRWARYARFLRPHLLGSSGSKVWVGRRRWWVSDVGQPGRAIV